MIIISHKELEAHNNQLNIVQPHIHIKRPYTDTDIILKRDLDYYKPDPNNPNIELSKSQLEELIQRTHEQAYNQGHKDAMYQMLK